jgi:hypothetical protein
VFFSALTLFWQLFILFACCGGMGLFLDCFFPEQLPPMNRAIFILTGGLFLTVLIPQNLVYLGVPVRLSGWLTLLLAILQGWLCRRGLIVRWRTSYLNRDAQVLTAVVLLVVLVHGFVPVRQGLEWYYGKGHFDQINYAFLAEFLKEEPYGTSEQDIGLRPWLVGPVGFHDTTGKPSSGLETIGLKNERIGQSIITAEIAVWSGTDGKGSYAASMIFFLALLAISLFVFLRGTGIDPFMAGSGALLAAFLPAVTRLSLDGFLSQISILFIFPYLATLLRPDQWSAKSFVLLFSLLLAYVVAAYSEIAPIGICTFLLGVLFIRHDTFPVKRLMIMGTILLVTLVNPYYVGKLIEFLAYQYNLAANAGSLWDNVAPNVLTLRGWSELVFGVSNGPWALLFACWAIALGLISLAGAALLSRDDKRIYLVILLPFIPVVLYFATRNPPSYYPIAKLTLTILPFVIGLGFIAAARIAANHSRPVAILKKLLCLVTIVAVGAGSLRYYAEVLDNQGLLKIFREPRFLEVCGALEETKNKRVLVFETHPLLAAWLCYHGRHNEVYFDGRLISDSPVPPNLPFSGVPDLANVDLVATRDQVVDLKAPTATCLTSVDDTPGEDRTEVHTRYLLGPPARLRFLALRTISANLKMQLMPGPAAESSPVDYFLTDADGHVFQGSIAGKSLEVLRISLPRGLSYLELSVKSKDSSPNSEQAFPILAEMGSIEISDIALIPGK